MLIEFSVTNFRSIKDTQVLSMVASSSKERWEANTFAPNSPSTPRLLHSAMVLGPNASGKSNLVKALYSVANLVEHSASGKQRGDRLDLQPFRLAAKAAQAPSEFEIVFEQSSVRYQYGFSATAEGIREEWLIAFPEGRSQRWFARTVDPASEKTDWYFGPAFKGPKKTLSEATRPNALFLSTAVQLNNQQLQPVFDWFVDRLRAVPAGRDFPMQFDSYTATRCRKEGDRARVLEFLKAADLGIEGLSVEVAKWTAEDLPEGFPDELAKQFVGKERLEAYSRHHDLDTGEAVDFDFDDESDGTRNLFSWAGPWLDVLDRGLVLVIDELDTSLHPTLVRFLVNLFHSTETNPYGAQLICTTHDVTQLEGELRRDQVWFVEKRQQQTHLYPLSDFRPRKQEAVGRGYLRGRYGALPSPQPRRIRVVRPDLEHPRHPEKEPPRSRVIQARRRRSEASDAE
jgi:AAA15 family ATPase/GTPase